MPKHIILNKSDFTNYGWGMLLGQLGIEEVEEEQKVIDTVELQASILNISRD